MNMEEYHFKKYMEAVEQENWERAEHHDERYTDIIGKKEISTLGKVLLSALLVVGTSPFWLFWLFR